MDIYDTRRADLNIYMLRHNVLKWQVAQEIGIAAQTFSAKLRQPTDKFYEQVIEAVDNIVAERQKG